MTAQTIAILTMAEACVPGGREAFLRELAPLLADVQYYSAESVAKKLDVSLSCVKNWRAKGIIVPSAVITGGTVRYTLADIQQALNKMGREEEK